MYVLKGDDAGHRIELLDIYNRRARHRTTRHDSNSLDWIGIRDEFRAAVDRVGIRRHARNIRLHHIARLRR
jgi:hypothetical protein